MSDIAALESATDDEFYSLIGVYALPLLASPGETLFSGRQGAFASSSSEVLGREFNQAAFRDLGRRFLKEWANEISVAVCQQGRLNRDLKQRGVTELHVIAAIVSGAISNHLPSLAPFTGLLTVLGSFAAQTGLTSFCRILDEVNSREPPTQVK